jgi:hypothetical protein
VLLYIGITEGCKSPGKRAMFVSGDRPDETVYFEPFVSYLSYGLPFTDFICFLIRGKAEVFTPVEAPRCVTQIVDEMSEELTSFRCSVFVAA